MSNSIRYDTDFGQRTQGSVKRKRTFAQHEPVSAVRYRNKREIRKRLGRLQRNWRGRKNRLRDLTHTHEDIHPAESSLKTGRKTAPQLLSLRARVRINKYSHSAAGGL
jgi:hypothetical protein